MSLNPTRETLPNGVTVIVNENHTTPAVSLLLGIGAGGYDDPDGREGTAALVARVLDRGSRTRSAAAIADALDDRGASLAVGASRHALTVAATCLADDLGLILDIVADTVREPAFDEAEVSTRRRELLTTIDQEDDDPASMAVLGLMGELYQGHPYARRVRGTAASVAALDRDDLVRYHQACVAPGRVAAVIVGNVRTDEVVRTLEGRLGDWRTAGDGQASRSIPSVPDAPTARERRRIARPMPDKSQCDIAYGFGGLRRLDPGYLAASVMNNVLGQYALGGRLGDSIRERQGLAYYVYSSLDATFGPGPLMIRAGVAAADVERAIDSIDRELASLIGEGLTVKDVEQSRQYMVGALPRQLETNAAVASFLLNAEAFGLGLDYDRRLPDLIRGVTPEDATAAARRLLDPSRATIAVAGPLP